MTDHLAELSAQGVSIWLDDLTRQRIQSGGLKALLDDKHVVGVTTNPSIFQAAISKSDVYDDDINALAKAGKTVDEVVRQLTGDDVRAACDVLRPVFDATDGLDGAISYEVDPRLARKTEETIAQARDLWSAVDRPNLYIKIPATVEGIPAIRQVLSEGINVNVTLIFSTSRYADVMEAHLSALEERVARGEPVAHLSSVASFFVSRVDTEIDKRLLKLDTEESRALLGKAAVANARVAYEKFVATFSGPRWEALEAAGAKPQRPLWASTGVKNPDYPDTMYVTDLVAAGVVNTMPEPTLDAVADHGVITGDTITPNFTAAGEVLALIAGIGIDLAQVSEQLEDEGVEKFETAWNDLLSGVGGKVEAAR